jgi:tRNA pseudouridine38-40 synthase
LSCRELHRGLNAVLPLDIKVLEVVDVAPGFRAINDAIRKTYRYELQTGDVPDLFIRNFAWYVPRRLDVPAMQAAARCLIGRHDFASFQTTGSDRLTTVRTVERLEVSDRWHAPYHYVTLEITADGFLYNMVRAITGTLVKVGQGKESVEWVSRVLAACDRRVAGPTAPPQGLYLWSVEYPPNCQIPQNQLNYDNA